MSNPQWSRAACGLVLGLVLVHATAAHSSADLASWGEALTHHAREGGVDYAALAEAPEALDRFLASIAEVDPSGDTEAARAAFWINAYNAVAVRFVLDQYPGIASVRDVDGFFDEQRVRVAGRSLTLDEIEDLALEAGGERVHFAVNCASESCPELRGEPFTAGALERQLEDQVERFLTQPDHGLRFDAGDGVLWLSSIFKWYAGDFTGGSTVVAFFMRGGVLDWIVENAPERLAAPIRDSEPAIRYLDYDWSLNDRPSRPGS